MVHKHQCFNLLGKVVLERVIFTPPLQLLEKLNQEVCLLYALNGNSSLYSSDSKFSMQNEKGVLMKCGNYYNHWAMNVDNSNSEVVAIHFHSDVIRSIYEDKVPQFLIANRKVKSRSIQVIENNELIKPYIESLLFYFNNPQIVDDEVIILKVKELLNLLYKLNSNNIRDLMHDLFNPRNIDFKQTIQANLYENLSMEALAHLTNLSLSTFKRKFKEVFAETPSAYIRTKRLEKAAQLLQVSDERIIDVCFNCGFGNLDSFSKSFKKVYGLTPTEFRKRG